MYHDFKIAKKIKLNKLKSFYYRKCSNVTYKHATISLLTFVFSLQIHMIKLCTVSTDLRKLPDWLKCCNNLRELAVSEISFSLKVFSVWICVVVKLFPLQYLYMLQMLFKKVTHKSSLLTLKTVVWPLFLKSISILRSWAISTTTQQTPLVDEDCKDVVQTWRTKPVSGLKVHLCCFCCQMSKDAFMFQSIKRYFWAYSSDLSSFESIHSIIWCQNLYPAPKCVVSGSKVRVILHAASFCPCTDLFNLQLELQHKWDV